MTTTYTADDVREALRATADDFPQYAADAAACGTWADTVVTRDVVSRHGFTVIAAGTPALISPERHSLATGGDARTVVVLDDTLGTKYVSVFSGYLR